MAVASLNRISGWDASGFKELLSYPRIKDGITDEDTKIVAVLGGYAYQHGSAQVLLAETGVYIEERLIELPHTGETLLATIRTHDKVSQSMDHLEHVVRTIERFMDEPYPTNYLAVLYYDHPAMNNAWNQDTHLLFHAKDDAVDGGPSVPPRRVGPRGIPLVLDSHLGGLAIPMVDNGGRRRILQSVLGARANRAAA